jgi:hypothetical protein
MARIQHRLAITAASLVMAGAAAGCGGRAPRTTTTHSGRSLDLHGGVTLRFYCRKPVTPTCRHRADQLNKRSTVKPG